MLVLAVVVLVLLSCTGLPILDRLTAGGGPAIVVLPRWWRPADLDRLTVALAIPIEEMEPETPVAFSHGYPGNRLPSSLRHPLLFPLGVIAAVFAGLIGLIALVSGI